WTYMGMDARHRVDLDTHRFWEGSIWTLGSIWTPTDLPSPDAGRFGPAGRFGHPPIPSRRSTWTPTSETAAFIQLAAAECDVSRQRVRMEADSANGRDAHRRARPEQGNSGVRRFRKPSSGLLCWGTTCSRCPRRESMTDRGSRRAFALHRADPSRGRRACRGGLPRCPTLPLRRRSVGGLAEVLHR